MSIGNVSHTLCGQKKYPQSSAEVLRNPFVLLAWHSPCWLSFTCDVSGSVAWPWHTVYLIWSFSSYDLRKVVSEKKSTPCPKEGSVKPTSLSHRDLSGLFLNTTHNELSRQTHQSLVSFLLEDSFALISCTANEAYCFLSCLHWTWKIVCSSPFLFAALYTKDCSQVSSQPFSLNILFILSFPVFQVFWFPLLSSGLSPFGSICEVWSPNGAEYFSWALSHAEKGKHLTFLCFTVLPAFAIPTLRPTTVSQFEGEAGIFNPEAKQSRYSNITFGILLAPSGLVAEPTERSHLAPLLSFLSAQKGW